MNLSLLLAFCVGILSQKINNRWRHTIIDKTYHKLSLNKIFNITSISYLLLLFPLKLLKYRCVYKATFTRHQSKLVQCGRGVGGGWVQVNSSRPRRTDKKYLFSIFKLWLTSLFLSKSTLVIILNVYGLCSSW